MEEGEEVIRAHFEDNFTNLYTEHKPSKPKVDGMHIPCIEVSQVAWLERPFTEEVKKAVWIMEGDKSPRPNGFPLPFYKACWEVLREDLMLVIKDFYDKCFFDKVSNAMNISLIPKGKKPSGL